ncbi:MAG TPA: iron-containing alcohol dehydrogenase, partial [Thermoguttaceae bacterium]
MDSIPDYDFIAPQKIVFGWGRRSEVGKLGRMLGLRAFLVSGLPEELVNKIVNEICDTLRKESVEVVHAANILREPEVEDVDRLAEQIRREKPANGDLMIAIGGGAAIDLAKAAGAMATNDQSPTVKDFLENVGRDLKIVSPPLPVLAMPTTAGTG